MCLLHSYASPEHEARLEAALDDCAALSVSHRVSRERREFERASTTALNAALIPVIERYLSAQEEAIAGSFRPARPRFVVHSSGGMMTTETARRLPIKTIFSGPAGGVSQACFVGAAAGLRDFITYDMGGTSTDVCLVRDLPPLVTADAMVGAFPVKVSQIDMHTVGAGGGSIAWLDVDGSLQVGPRSAGATPGPAAYGLGGTEPAVTDANVVLGRIGTRRRLGGSIGIDPALARRAVAELALRMSRPLGVEALAEGIVTIAVARMTSAIREISIQRGHDPRDFTLIAFGGAGPMHALAMADEIGVPRVLVPRHPGNFSALGLLAADIKHDDVRTCLAPLGEAQWPRVERELEDLVGELVAALEDGRGALRRTASWLELPLPRPERRARGRARGRALAGGATSGLRRAAPQRVRVRDGRAGRGDRRSRTSLDRRGHGVGRSGA